MPVSSLRRLAARALSRLSDVLDPDPPEVVEVAPMRPVLAYAGFPPARQPVVQVFRPDPLLVADMDAIEAECAELLHSLDMDESCGAPRFVN